MHAIAICTCGCYVPQGSITVVWTPLATPYDWQLRGTPGANWHSTPVQRLRTYSSGEALTFNRILLQLGQVTLTEE